jgi:chromosome segregation ATPase
VAEVAKAIDDHTKRITKLIRSLEFLEGPEATEVQGRIKDLDKEREALKSQLAELQRAKASDDGRKSDLDKLFRTLEIAKLHSEELTYEGKRKWLEALRFSVKVWARDHKPR